jgi:hypothetical protein
LESPAHSYGFSIELAYIGNLNGCGLSWFFFSPNRIAKNTISRPVLLIVYFNLQQQDFTIRSSQQRFQRGIIMTDS